MKKAITMKIKLLIIIVLASILLLSCETEKSNIINCNLESTLGINSSDSTYVYFQDLDWKTNWYGWYSEELVEIHANFSNDGHHPNRQDVGYVFKKTNNCLEFDYAYRTNITWRYSRSAHTVNIEEVIIQDWEEDRLFSGKIIEINNHGDRLVRNFWVEFDTDDVYDFTYNANTTANCIDNTTPKEIDLNSDGITDISLEKIENPLTNYDVNLKSTNSIKLITHNNNSILWGDYGLFSEAPFTTNNRNEHIPGNDTEDILSILFEYYPPYDRFNLWYAYGPGFRYNIQTVPWGHPSNADFNIINNNVDDYLMVKIEKDGEYYYGWIKMKIDFDNCQFEVLETYLNPNPNEHVSVN